MLMRKHAEGDRPADRGRHQYFGAERRFELRARPEKRDGGQYDVRVVGQPAGLHLSAGMAAGGPRHDCQHHQGNCPNGEDMQDRDLRHSQVPTATAAKPTGTNR